MTQHFLDTGPGHVRPPVDAASTAGHAKHASSPRFVLVVDDDPVVSRAIEIALGPAGWQVDRAADPDDAYSRLAARRYDAILLDLNFAPGHSDGKAGLAALRRIIAADADARVLVVTAHGGVRTAVAAMQRGARDFIAKPWRNADLVAKLDALTAAPAPALPMPADTAPVLLGDSAVMMALRELVGRIGPTNASVAVSGPAGSGRMLTALALHAASDTAAHPPVRIDLRDAAWTLPDTGTAILRYPDRLDAVAQARLIDRLAPSLRVLALVDAAADLAPALRRRIATLEIAVPPLAARGDDAGLLARHFARVAAQRFGRPPPRLTPAAHAAVMATRWTDEVRGLAAAVERAVLLADDGVIDVALLLPPPAPRLQPTPPQPHALADAERSVIAAALAEHRHNVTEAAAALGLSRGTLYRRMARHGL